MKGQGYADHNSWPCGEVRSKHILWVKVNPDFEIFFSLLDGLRADTRRRYWISEQGTVVNTCDMGEDLGHTVTEVKIALQMFHKHLTTTEEYIK